MILTILLLLGFALGFSFGKFMTKSKKNDPDGRLVIDRWDDDDYEEACRCENSQDEAMCDLKACDKCDGETITK